MVKGLINLGNNYLIYHLGLEIEEGLNPKNISLLTLLRNSMYNIIFVIDRCVARGVLQV
jgi:hypothetical protein